MNWFKIGKQIKNEAYDLVIVRYWLPFMAPVLGTICRQIKKNKYTKIICIADNIVPHEKSKIDQLLTRYFVQPIDGFLTMSDTVSQTLRTITNKPATQAVHPLYDSFSPAISQAVARTELNIPIQDKVILFFGFIRAYKGLDILLEAMALPTIRAMNIKLLVAGEFYEKKEKYFDLIQSKKIESTVLMHNQFIPDSEVHRYFSAADFVIQPYKTATQSGITPLAIFYEKPMLVTNVGSLPDRVFNKNIGEVCLPNAASVAAGIATLYANQNISYSPYLANEKSLYSWKQFLITLLTLKNNI